MTAQLVLYFPHLSLALGGLVILLAACLRRTPATLFPILAGVFAALPGLWSLAGPTGASGIGCYYAGLLSVITLATVALTARYAARRGFAGDALYGLVLWSALGMLLLAASDDWLMLIVGLELASLCLYAVVASRLSDPLGTEAALKYFLPGAMSLAVLVFGAALVYAGSGSLIIADSLAAGGPIVSAGLALALIGIGFKLSLAPVHLWTPDVYQGAPAPIAAFLSTGSKAATAAALLHLCAEASPEARELLWPALAGVAGLTMAAGNIGALCQKSVKRILAYSSIAQMGYIAMAAMAVNDGGGEAALFYLAAFALMDLGAFGAVGLLSGEIGDRDDVTAYQGLGYVHPWRAGALAISLLSLAGLPPTAGFIGKFLVFGAALRAGYVGLAAFGIVTAVIGIFYALRVVAALYMQSGVEAHPAIPAPAGPAGGLALGVMAAGVLALGLFPQSLLGAIAALFGGG
ncbi:NADH-quinone oxidoreductase subunit N [Desulfovibrio aerotolerans]|uniref:NADH-quinone oxidoreductase subunit N n=1 Tax=Solidesulfovibrio aerotolerans TaxID=295255 RepID=A0A7C9IVT0_9BACT|nr:NADH-quinone oxidoreductase subunit N [Solidesulfovibrio aerotolerans]MYL82982.1 NADH-quinone oxidoreductase subunit N [Solidesulfovibrio aerotolerans]